MKITKETMDPTIMTGPPTVMNHLLTLVTTHKTKIRTVVPRLMAVLHRRRYLRRRPTDQVPMVVVVAIHILSMDHPVPEVQIGDTIISGMITNYHASLWHGSFSS